MSSDLIRYDLLAQEALRGLVRRVLTDVAREGLPGNHHFYISFNTTAPGVRISARLLEQHPNEMTIVLQHQFWDLEITEHTFSVGLSFGGIPEKLLVPFEAITGFFDPSVQFGLKFEPATETGGKNAEDEEAAGADGDGETAPAFAAHSPAPAQGNEPGQPTPAPDEDEDKGGDTGAQVVSLDKFRKK